MASGAARMANCNGSPFGPLANLQELVLSEHHVIALGHERGGRIMGEAIVGLRSGKNCGS